MPFSVTSWFESQTLLQSPDNLVRKFYIGTSDYSEKVVKWPKFKKKWNDIRPITLNVQLANEDQEMNFMREDKTTMVQSCSLQIGYTHENSGDELITLFAGYSEKVKYRREMCELSIADKFKQLTERTIGDDDTPVTYTDTNYLPSDLAWYAVTSYGGYSALESTSNPDIDYAAYINWAEVFSGDSVYVNGEFSGEKCAEVLRKIGRYTQSAIYVQDNKITFHRFSVADSNQLTLNNDNIDDLIVEFDDDHTVNKQYVNGGWTVDSEYTITVWEEDTPSVNSFGLKEDTEEDEHIWYVTSGSCKNLAERIILTKGEPYDKLTIKTYMEGIIYLIGETIICTDPFHDIDGNYRIMEQEIDTKTGMVTFMCDQSQFLGAFILDVSTLNGPDTLI